ncbi:hypothetical protein JI739_10955 [Ramlibacter sp. AW1]|uniref:DUF4157 domain-containing protein n=1 Tax=Ramlibacter aurantiacus TaxID=2801330 RepID=A0A936ZG52_9BURK|nr:hypothetical protein [Ramlibacter aurantiacus]MBL0420864.1 hypothetical protein [Ramlibacter aurantiacus]
MIVHSRMLVWACGMTVTPRLIIIHPRFRGHPGLLAHEKVHAEQMRRDGLLRFWWRYASSRRHRLAYEVEAYRVSMAHGCTLASAARTLATGYWLGIDEQQARHALLDLPHSRRSA